ncbi:MAG: nuclear transport factor 2 family protein [Novosphingobium sp.]|nr:nuclear transport factor 2 family protein [Novosphingobium sp.]
MTSRNCDPAMPASADPVHPELRALLDRQQITQALYTYCRAVDRIDRELGWSIWAEGATVDYGPSLYVGDARGLIDWICSSHEKGIAHSHQITNILIRLEGENAASEAYVDAAMRMMQDGRLLQVNTRGRYLDHWVKLAGRWLIRRRVFVCDFDEMHAVEPGSIPPRLALDRSDPSYALLGDAW